MRLQAILDIVHPTSTAAYIALQSTDGKFSASVPLDAVRNAVIAYRLGNEPLPAKKGGPFRFLIPNVEDCYRRGRCLRQCQISRRDAL